MEAAGAWTAVIALPERVDRRLRLGPFPSARDALKFLAYAAVGAVLDGPIGPGAAVAVVVAGFVLSVWKPDGEAVDERAVSFVRWKLRPRPVEGDVTGNPDRGLPLLRAGFLRVGPSFLAVVVRTGGTPVAYLPPEELARRFELYRELLGSSEGPIAFLVTGASLRAEPFAPARTAKEEPDREARSGYVQLVELLCRRRSVRRVYVALAGIAEGPDAFARLDATAARAVERLEEFGVRPVRLRGRELAEAGRRLGWLLAGSGT